MAPKDDAEQRRTTHSGIIVPQRGMDCDNVGGTSHQYHFAIVMDTKDETPPYAVVCTWTALTAYAVLQMWVKLLRTMLSIIMHKWIRGSGRGGAMSTIPMCLTYLAKVRRATSHIGQSIWFQAIEQQQIQQSVHHGNSVTNNKCM